MGHLSPGRIPVPRPGKPHGPRGKDLVDDTFQQLEELRQDAEIAKRACMNCRFASKSHLWCSEWKAEMPDCWDVRRDSCSFFHNRNQPIPGNK